VERVTEKGGAPRGSGVPVGSEGELILGLAAGRQLRWAAVELAGPAEEARLRHDLSPIAASALGRSLAGAALLQRLSARSCRRLTLTVSGDGPLGRIVAEAGAGGDLRGLVDHPVVEVPARADGRLSVGAAVGRGFLKVRRELTDGSGWESQVELSTGEIGLDLAHFLEQSEQVRCAVLVGVLEGPEGVRAAGGMIVEALPEAPEAPIERLQSNLAGLAGISRLLSDRDLGRLLDPVFNGLDREPVERSRVRFRCSCRRDALLPRLATLSSGDREELADERGLIEAQCAFCGARYVFSKGELETQ
jgi:molecular chaperone Hsp33